MIPNKTELRKTIHQKRRELSQDFQQQASECICKTLKKHAHIQEAATIATYYSTDGEANPFPLTQQLKKIWLLPVVSQLTMHFATFSDENDLIKNRYGIPEPKNTEAVALSSIDVILVPLVGFDKNGNRIGRGAGYYDRALAVNQDTRAKRPYLIGIAYECQKVQPFQPQDWDIPLHEVITEANCYKTYR